MFGLVSQANVLLGITSGLDASQKKIILGQGFCFLKWQGVLRQ